jgi:hypothetical protein
MFTLLLLLIITFFLTWKGWNYNNGLKEGRESVRVEAIKNGFAEYKIVNEEKGVTEFRWKEKDN